MESHPKLPTRSKAHLHQRRGLSPHKHRAEAQMGAEGAKIRSGENERGLVRNGKLRLCKFTRIDGTAEDVGATAKEERRAISRDTRSTPHVAGAAEGLRNGCRRCRQSYGFSGQPTCDHAEHRDWEKRPGKWAHIDSAPWRDNIPRRRVGASLPWTC